MGKIIVDNVSVVYKEKKKSYQALKDVSFTIQDGEFVSIIGPSGCGKSTLLSVLEGILHQSSGHVYINDSEVLGTGTDRGVVFQSYSLFPWLSAKNNIVFGVHQKNKKLSKDELYAIADEYLEKVNLREFADKYPSQLSGGQQQRVAIARALAMDTEILLMDEPFGAIDPKNRTELQELLLKLWEGEKKNGEGKKKKTVVFVTHDIDEAIFLSDRIVMMASNPGHVFKEISVPSIRPRNRSDLFQTSSYVQLRNELVSLFYKDVAEKIDEEVVL